jgi:hypothetical protein
LRGTDFEIRIDADRSGYIRMYEGLNAFTIVGNSSPRTLRAGQTLRFKGTVITGIE